MSLHFAHIKTMLYLINVSRTIQIYVHNVRLKLLTSENLAAKKLEFFPCTFSSKGIKYLY